MNISDELELQLWARRPFSSSEAEQAAFADPRYQRSADFRNAVAQKLALSSNGIAPVVHSRAPLLEVGGIGTSGTEAAVQAEERKAAEQMLVEQYGPLAVAPPPVPVVRKSNEVISQWNRGSAGPTVRVLPDFYTK
jgi:hypothetical protein